LYEELPVSDPEKTEPSASQIICEFIRSASRDVRLASKTEISKIDGLRGDEDAQDLDTLLREALESNEDLRDLTTADEPHYYSTLYMTTPYARLLAGKSRPLHLIAELVRENSSIYPRPVPVDSFKEPPFQMTEDEIQTFLALLEKEEGMEDIRRTTTSTGAVYLFSSLYLERDHADMLAERLDVGQLIDP
jgi:hypothetical protein